MSDRMFFSLAALVAGTFVFVALAPYADRPPRGPVSGGGRNAEDVTVRGEELHRMLPGNFGGLTIETPGGKGDPIVRISRLAEQAYDDPRQGPHIVLAEDLEYAFESRRIEVTIEARSVGEFAASQFEADYLAKVGSESDWQVFDLTRDFQPYSFQWKVPSRGLTEGYDYVGVRPVAPDKRRTMEVKSIRVRTLSAKDKPGT